MSDETHYHKCDSCLHVWRHDGGHHYCPKCGAAQSGPIVPHHQPTLEEVARCEADEELRSQTHSP